MNTQMSYVILLQIIISQFCDAFQLSSKSSQVF